MVLSTGGSSTYGKTLLPRRRRWRLAAAAACTTTADDKETNETKKKVITIGFFFFTVLITIHDGAERAHLTTTFSPNGRLFLGVRRPRLPAGEGEAILMTSLAVRDGGDNNRSTKYSCFFDTFFPYGGATVWWRSGKIPTTIRSPVCTAYGKHYNAHATGRI